VRKGLIDHSDSLGATARFGGGDVQWLTAGSGIVHAEMFPLLDTDRDNPLELFQIWLNLPARSKMAAPHFTMFWSEDIPHLRAEGVEVVNIAGRLTQAGDSLAPPPDSWASQAPADLAIWTLRLSPGARWTLPAATGASTRRKLYFFKGSDATLAGQQVGAQSAVELDARMEAEIVNGDQTAEFLMLQARPLAEPVAQYGPFVMNTRAEIEQAFEDYRRTQFGGWPWPDAGPVHGAAPQRFARHADGRHDARTEVARG